MRKLYAFILALVYLSVCNFAFASEDQPTPQKYTLISSKDLEHVHPMLRNSIMTLFPDAQEAYLDYKDPKAKRYIQELDAKFIPIVIYDKSITDTDAFFHMVKHKMINKLNGYYVIPDEQMKFAEVMLLNRKRQPNELSVFVTSLCPYTKGAQAALANFITQRKINANVQIKYLATFSEFGISSSRGPAEIKENLRQITIQEYYSDKFFDYLLLIQDMSSEEALGKLGISQKDIDSKKDKALEILKEHAQFAQELQIEYSPTFLWENMYLIPSLEILQIRPPFNNKITRVFDKSLLAAPIEIDFFYSEACRNCWSVKKKLLPSLKEKYQDQIAINYHETSDPEALALKLTMEKEYGAIKPGIPKVFLPHMVLEGESEINEELPRALEDIFEGKIEVQEEKVIASDNPIIGNFSSFSPTVITVAGLIDGINPCAFATMVFFISFLSLNNYRKKQIVYIGSSFIVAVFLTYLALGLGIFTAFKKLQVFSLFSQLLYYAIALLALGLGVYALCDYIQYKRTGETKGCSLKLYNRLRSLVDNKRGMLILIVGAFINGFIIALLESACTGQVYFPTIAFVMKVPTLRLNALFYLILYNLAFILPLVGIFLLTYKGLTSEKLSSFTNRHLGAIKLATALLFFALAGLLFIFI